jgi:O-antigen/teichoic acid export membrane protein
VRTQFRTSSALLLSVARGGSLLGFVVATGLLARALTPDAYGTFRQCWTGYLLLVPIASTGLAQSLFYFVPLSEEEGRWALVRRTLLAATLVGIVSAVAVALGAGALARAFHNNSATLAFSVFALFLATSIPMQLADSIFMSVGRSGLAAIFNVMNRTTVLIGLAAPVAFLHLPLETSLALLGAVQAVVLAAMCLLARGAHRGYARSVRTVSLLHQLRFALPVTAAGLFGAIFLQIDKLIVSMFASPAEFAVYSNGAFENPAVALVVAASSATVTSQLVRMRSCNDTAGFIELWTTMVERVALVLLPLGAFLFAFAPETVIVLFSPRYAESSNVFRAYVLLTPIRIIAFSTLFASLNRNAIYLAGHVAACALVAIGAPLLFRGIDILGPVVALVVTSYALAAWLLSAAARDLAARVGDMLPYRRLARILVAGAGAGLAARLVVDELAPGGPIAALAIGGIVFGALVLGVYFVLGVFRRRVVARVVSPEDARTGAA